MSDHKLLEPVSKRVEWLRLAWNFKGLSKAFLDGAMWTPTTRRQYSRGELRYDSDLSDGEWRLIAAWMPRHSGYGRPLAWSWRAIMNAIFYIMRTGCPVAVSARRVPAVADGLPLVRGLSRWRPVRADQSCAGDGRPPTGWPGNLAVGGNHRQPERQNHGKRRPQRL